MRRLGNWAKDWGLSALFGLCFVMYIGACVFNVYLSNLNKTPDVYPYTFPESEVGDRCLTFKEPYRKGCDYSRPQRWVIFNIRTDKAVVFDWEAAAWIPWDREPWEVTEMDAVPLEEREWYQESKRSRKEVD